MVAAAAGMSYGVIRLSEGSVGGCALAVVAVIAQLSPSKMIQAGD